VGGGAVCESVCVCACICVCLCQNWVQQANPCAFTTKHAWLKEGQI